MVMYHFSMGMNIKNLCKIFHYGSRGSTFLDFFNNAFTTDTRTPKTYLYLMRLMLERKFLLIVTFIFPVPLLLPHKTALLLTTLSIVLHCQPLRWRILILILSILLENKEPRREVDITELLEVTVK